MLTKWLVLSLTAGTLFASAMAASPAPIATDTPIRSQLIADEQAEARFICTVRNGRGRAFEGRGANPEIARQRAMSKCGAVSQRCRAEGCSRF
jgi:hypothetical protein